MLNEKTFYDLSLLSYFDFYDVEVSVANMIESILADEQLYEDYKNDTEFSNNRNLLFDIKTEDYEDMKVKEFFDDNANSGVVYYVFETEEALFFAFRGSEAIDSIHHRTRWQDWQDNFQMFLKHPTYQQIYTLHNIQQISIHKPFYLCGHSKGGNLALFVALTMREDLLEKLRSVVSFNAPGLTKHVLSTYRQRAEDEAFIKKLTIIENENDCVSAFFENLTQPIFIKSALPCTNLNELQQNHNLCAMDFRDNMYLLAEKKTAVPKLFYHFVNDFFMNLKEERLQGVVSKMDELFAKSPTQEDLYKLVLYHVNQYISLFEDIPEEELATISFQELIERRKTKNIMLKVKELQPKEKIHKVADTIRHNTPIHKLNEMDVKEITRGMMDNYEMIVKERAKEFHNRIKENNECIISAIKAIRRRNNVE